MVCTYDAASGKQVLTDIPLSGGVYGSERLYAEVEAETSTTSTTPVTRVSLVTGAGLPAGTYRVEWYCERRYNRTNRDWEGQVTVDGSPIGEINVESKDSTNWEDWAGHRELALTAGVHTILLQWNRESNPGAAFIRRARLSFFRVA